MFEKGNSVPKQIVPHVQPNLMFELLGAVLAHHPTLAALLIAITAAFAAAWQVTRKRGISVPIMVGTAVPSKRGERKRGKRHKRRRRR